MTGELALVLGLLAAAIAMFAINKPRMDAVALIMLTALPLTGVIALSEALAGFSDANVVLIAALFVIGDGLVRSGVARGLGDWLAAKAGRSEARLIALLMVVVCGLGSLMSSTAVTAIFVPVALRISQSTGASASRLMMPLSTAALISGMMTLIATAPNLIVSSELERHGFDGFRFFAFTPFGVPILAAGVVYMLFARHWLGRADKAATPRASGPSLSQWIDEYQLADREHCVEITPNSPLAGMTMEQLRREAIPGAHLLAIQRGNQLIEPADTAALAAGDILLVDYDSPPAQAEELRERYALEELPFSGAYFADLSQAIGMAEILLPPTSGLIGKSLKETAFHDRYGVRVIGIRRKNVAYARELAVQDLKLGDTLLVVGPWREIRRLQGERGDIVLLNVPVEIDDVLPAPGKRLPALFCLTLVIVLMVSGLVPNVLAALIGCLLMGAFGVTDLNAAYRSIDWKTLVVIVGMLPFSTALQHTGGVKLVADALMSVIGGAGDHVILACLFACTALLGMFISNTATAVLMASVALAVAKDMHASPYPFAMIVALAASTAFMTPVSSPVNMLVVTPGNYTFGDFVRVGVPFSLIVMLICVLLVPWLLPLAPAAAGASLP